MKMTNNTNKVIIVLVLVSLVATVIGSWLILNGVENAQRVCTQNNAAPVMIKYADSGRVTLTIAPTGPMNIASGKIVLDLQRSE
jgi:hypothetical protein